MILARRGSVCAIVRLWSSSSREGAHRRYEHLGYVNIKTQYAFLKALDGSGHGAFRSFVPRVQRTEDR